MRVIAGFLLLLVLGSGSPNNVKEDNSLKKYFDDNKVHRLLCPDE
jgi:hypothetical protein